MANQKSKKQAMRARRKLRIRKRVNGTADCPRLAVFRSLKHVQAQIIDDTSGRALLGVSSSAKNLQDHLGDAKGKCAQSREIGKLLAAKAKEAGISRVVFDRGGYIYHGRIKALAEGAREGGLEF